MVVLSLAAAFLLGVYVGNAAHLPTGALVSFGLAAAMLAVLMRTYRRSALPALLLLVAILGAARSGGALQGPADSLIAYHNATTVRLEGVVISDPRAAGPALRFRLAANQIAGDGDWTDATGDVMVTLRPTSELVRARESPRVRYGDRLLLVGVVSAPPELEGFDYPAFLERQGIRSVVSFPDVTLLKESEGSWLRRALSGMRLSLARSIARSVPEPQAALGQALVIGKRDRLPDQMVEDFRVTGTSHLLAISGLHLGILLGLSLSISAWLLGRRAQIYLLAPLLFIWSYAMLAGMSPSVVRAAIMGSIYLAALALGRPRSVLPALGLAAAAMVALEPRVLWNISFQLSFAAMAGIAALSESIASKLGVIAAAGPEEGEGVNTLSTLVLRMVSMTMAATLATLPIVAFYFERVSLVGVPATLLTLPALPLVLVTQAAAGAAGLLFQPAGQILGWLAWIATSYLSGIVAVLGRVPGASFETGAVAPILVWVYYGGLVVWYGAERYGSRPPGLASAVRSAGGAPFAAAGRVPSWVSLPAVAVAALIWVAALSLPDGKLRVTFADVGQGDAALIGTPSGRNILIDGGPSPARLVRLLGNKLSFWDRSIDLVVLTHPHEDHVSGLTEALRKYEIEHVLGPEVQYDSPAHEDWRGAVRSEGARVIRATAGQTIDFGDGVLIQVLNPPERRLEGTVSDLDNASVVVRMVYGDVSFLFTGDVFSEAEAWLVGTDAPIDSDVLKVAHHGSRSSSGEEFVEKVSPVAAVISVGEKNRHGHPHAETLETLHRHVASALVFETMEVGYIEFVTDGRTLEVTTER